MTNTINFDEKNNVEKEELSDGIDTDLTNKKLYKKFVIPALITQCFVGIMQLADKTISCFIY